jgi:FkbM family methyltransferase
MDNRPQIDVEEILECVREAIRKRGPELSLEEMASTPPNGQGAVNLASLHRCKDIYNIHFTSHRKILGWPIVFAKKLLRRLLTPILERQVIYNTANTHVVSALWAHGRVISQQQEAVLQMLRKETAEKDHGMNGEFAELMQHLQLLLRSYNNLNYGRQLSPVDAFFAIRLLLGRNPDLRNEVPHILSDTRTFREFLNDLLNSEEFSHCAGFVPPNRVFMVELQDFRLWFNTSDREMGMIMASGQYEPQSVELLKSIIRPGMKCVDAGAHIGFYTCLIASLVGETGKVYAFEPMPSHFKLLLRNIEENQLQQVTRAYNLACSDVCGSLNVSKIPNMFVVGQVGNTEQVTVEAVRLEDVIEDMIDFVKLDVEGHEPAVIHGMVSIISKHKPIILSEINEYWLRSCSHSSGAEYVGLLKSLGYDVFDVKNLEHPLSEGSLKLDILDTIDVVAFPRGRVC